MATVPHSLFYVGALILNACTATAFPFRARQNQDQELLNSTIQDDGFTRGQGYGNATVRYRSVPNGICELVSGVKSYAGYVDISPHIHMFFWLFEARNRDPTTAPLTAWISGGPGDSGMSELFTEHGPCRIHPDGKTVQFNPFSWNNYSNVVYIDQPVQVGFSYTDLVPGYVTADGNNIRQLNPGQACPPSAQICGNFSTPDPSTTANSTVAAAPNFWLTLQSIMTTFPQYSHNGFHFGSESYGGHYVPVFSNYIMDQNNNLPSGAVHIDLQSILVGNGWYSPQMQTASYLNYAFDPGSPYDLPKFNDTIKNMAYEAYYGAGKCRDQTNNCASTGSDDVCRKADHYCGNHVQGAFDISKRDEDDVREIADSPFPNEFYSNYLQIDSVRRAIGARQTYIELNPTVAIAFDSTGDDARELGIIKILGDLLTQGVRVTLYAGDADYECNWLGGEAVAYAVQANGFGTAGYTNIVTPDHITHGQVKQSGGFSFVRVYQAGHAVGAFQPLLQQTIFARTISGKDLATGKQGVSAQYHTTGTHNSTYREGNGTVLYHHQPQRSTYNYTSNLPTLNDFQPSWNGPLDPA